MLRPIVGVVIPLSTTLRPAPLVQRTCKLVAQDGWITGVDNGGRAYYFREQTGEFQYDPPQAVQQNYGGQILWRLNGLRGIHYWCKYALSNGDVQSLSRFNMHEQKLTVSRVQCIVQIHDGTATLTSCGKSPTLWRTLGSPRWIALEKGDQVPLCDGDQVSLDANDPEGAVFRCVEEFAMQQQQQQQQGSYQQGSYQQHGQQQGQQHGQQGYDQGYPPQQQGYGQVYDPGHAQQPGGYQPQLPYPWQQLVDPNGQVYYSNPQTGEASWEPPLEPPQHEQGGGYSGGYPQQQGGY